MPAALSAGMRASASPLLYFGKLPSRGDFVRSAPNVPVLQALDRWLSAGMELLSEDTRWKLLYDRAVPVQFAFVGSRVPQGLAGHLIASQDASGRRFPFVAAAAFDSADPMAFFARAPLALARPWQRLGSVARQAHASADAAPVLMQGAEAGVPIDGDLAAVDAEFQDFRALQTIGSLQSLLAAAGHAVNLRQLLLGLGLLLQPVPPSGQNRLERGLRLPLPADAQLRPLVGAWWLDLVGGFLARAAFEIALFTTPGDADGQAPTLCVGFEGNSARALHALLDPDLAVELYVDTTQADWVEPAASSGYAMHKLSSYLQQEGLSLQQASDSFKEVFLGR